MPGAGRLMRELHAAGFALAIGSSGPPENVEVVARRLSQGRLLGATVHGLEVPRGKPDPAIFLLAASRLHVPPARCVVVEDAPAGIAAARAAGMAVVAVTGTAPREKLTGADLIVDSLTELSASAIAALIDRPRRPMMLPGAVDGRGDRPYSRWCGPNGHRRPEPGEVAEWLKATVC